MSDDQGVMMDFSGSVGSSSLENDLGIINKEHRETNALIRNANTEVNNAVEDWNSKKNAEDRQESMLRNSIQASEQEDRRTAAIQINKGLVADSKELNDNAPIVDHVVMNRSLSDRVDALNDNLADTTERLEEAKKGNNPTLIRQLTAEKRNNTISLGDMKAHERVMQANTARVSLNETMRTSISSGNTPAEAMALLIEDTGYEISEDTQGQLDTLQALHGIVNSELAKGDPNNLTDLITMRESITEQFSELTGRADESYVMAVSADRLLSPSPNLGVHFTTFGLHS